jgi:hypothetical protein
VSEPAPNQLQPDAIPTHTLSTRVTAVKRSPPPQHRSAAAGGLTSRRELRRATATRTRESLQELHDNVACPGSHREAATSAPTPKRRGEWTGVGHELRGALTNAARPEDERECSCRVTSAARPTGVATSGIPYLNRERSYLRGGTWLYVQVHRLFVAREVDIGQ